LAADEFAGGQKIQKKEAVVTSVYTIAARPRTPEDVLASYFDKAPTDPAKKRNRQQNKKLWATLQGKDTAFQRLRRQATAPETTAVAGKALHKAANYDEYHAFQRQRRQKRLYYPDSPEAFVPIVYHQLPLAI
jgi:hypothetical protein